MEDLIMWPRWVWMWLLAFAIYVTLKLMTWSTRTVHAPSWKHLAYLFAWPGMDCDKFLGKDVSRTQRPAKGEWLFAFAKLGLGIGILWGLVPRIASAGTVLQAWAGLVGIVFVLHFGLFHVLSCVWRRVGVDATPIMNWPVCATSVTEFWGRRWNLAFRDLTHRFLFFPLKRRLGPANALLAGFVVSGLVHDLVISGPSGGGWGLPTLYFLIQAAGLVFERTRTARNLKLGKGLSGWIFCVVVVAAPSPLLFHTPFLKNVIEPFLQAIGSVP